MSKKAVRPARRAATRDLDTWKPAVCCPECRRPPAIRFAGREVQRARTERQMARLQNVQCTFCRTVYWIQARHVAEATLDSPTPAA